MFEFEGCNLMIGLGSFCDVKPMIVRPNKVEDSWAIVYFHIEKFFEVMS